jgi:ergothioneine biosynthesis protein EgtB
MQNQFLNQFRVVRSRTEEICKPLQTEDYVVQPIVDVSPPKWHLGHTTWFYENFLLVPFFDNYELFHSEFNYVFNSYYESVGARVLRTDRGNLSRPTTNEVYSYRAYVNEHMDQLIQSEKGTQEDFLFILEMGLNHEQQHQELLMYDIKYILGNNPLFPAYHDEEKLSNSNNKTTDLTFETIEEGVYTIGYEGSGFHFDNEKGVHKVYLNPFEISNRLISNREYIEFIEAGGYTSFQFWLAEGWDWVNTNQVKSPEYWHEIDGEWWNYTLSGLQKVEMEAPVSHISFFEADAYARWKGMRLPTEFEWEIASQQLGTIRKGCFVEGGQLAPTIQSEAGQHYFGSLWEWTSSAYRPYPNYTPPDGALGEYNGKFMINQMVLRGGSIATPEKHYRPTYRNFFHPNLRWLMNGFRLAKSL